MLDKFSDKNITKICNFVAKNSSFFAASFLDQERLNAFMDYKMKDQETSVREIFEPLHEEFRTALNYTADFKKVTYTKIENAYREAIVGGKDRGVGIFYGNKITLWNFLSSHPLMLDFFATYSSDLNELAQQWNKFIAPQPQPTFQNPGFSFFSHQFDDIFKRDVSSSPSAFTKR